jgi:hypothetical protein
MTTQTPAINENVFEDLNSPIFRAKKFNFSSDKKASNTTSSKTQNVKLNKNSSDITEVQSDKSSDKD